MPIQHFEARPVIEIRCQSTRALVGWLYRWNTGEHGTFWKETKFSGAVEYVPLSNGPIPKEPV